MKKKFLDILLLILFFVGLASTFLTEEMHELCGFVFIGAVFVHNFVNRNFYKNFSKISSLNRFCVIFFAGALVALTLSGIMLWQGESNFNWRSVHLTAAICSVILLFIHLLTHARKYIHGKIFYVASIFTFLFAVAGIFGLPYLDRWYHKVEVNSATIIQGEKISSDKKILTIYFSRVGNTNFPPEVDAVSGASIMKDKNDIIGNAQMIAQMAQNIAGGDLIEIQTEKIYPANYSETTKVSKIEFERNELPKIKNLPDIESYDKIILVYPLWWSKLPKPVESFLRNYNLSGKMIIPIVTHGGGGIGESVEDLKNAVNAKITKPLDIYSSDIPSSREEILQYLKGVMKQ